MTDEKGTNTGDTDGDIDPAESENALTPSEFDLIHDAETMRLGWEVFQDMDEDARENSLTPTQMEAAALVAMGLNDTEIGRMMGVTRQTVNIWKNHNRAFMEEVTIKRGEVWESYRIQFRTMIPRAIEVLSKALDDYDKRTRMEAAMFIMRSVKLEPIALKKRKGGGEVD